MQSKIKVGIVGYGNLGKGAEIALNKQSDMELLAIFTRRDVNSIETLNSNARVENVEAYQNYAGKIDVMVLCGGSIADLPSQGPQFARMFNTVDSFDTHAKIPEYYAAVNSAAEKAKKVSVISVGWDPGLFSLNRMMAEAILPEGENYTFWGKGVSQGHSDAIRRVKGVKDGIQYTVPLEKAIKKVRCGQKPCLCTREKHFRQCFVVPEEGADLKGIEHEIKTMPNYFADYDTEVNFISETELRAKHPRIPHGGFIIRSGSTHGNNNHVIEYSLKLDSNPEFTASVLVAYARAAHRCFRNGHYGAKTIFDIPLAYLSPFEDEELRARLL